MVVAGEVELLDWTARQIRCDQCGWTPASAEPVFRRLGIRAEKRTELVRDFGRLFCIVAGQPHVIDSPRNRRGSPRYKNRQRARKLLVGPSVCSHRFTVSSTATTSSTTSTTTRSCVVRHASTCSADSLAR